MSPFSSSRFAASISKTLNPRTCSTNQIPKSLTTVADLPSSQSQEGGRLSRWLLFLPGAITFGLGSWQIARRQDKIEMLEYRRSRLGLEPLTLNSVSSSQESDSLEFRRVICEGVFDESKSIYVGPRSRSISGVTENGYYVITPLMPLPDVPSSVQAPVMVNRGWVPRSWRDECLQNSSSNDEPLLNLKPANAESKEGTSWWNFWSKKPTSIVQEQGPAITPVKVIGVVRGSEKPSIFVPENEPSSGQWFYVDVPMIARASGLPQNTVYIEENKENIDPSKPYPLPKDVSTLIRTSVMPQDHLNYTFTWYSLSAAVTFMAMKRLKTKKIKR
ncbi:hypothetical protein ACHQM5_015671 [Ranunculus cassubicifolius]